MDGSLMIACVPVDVIVPIFNQPSFVRSCIQSLISAKQQTPYEIIAIDDASTGAETQEMLEKFASDGVICLLRNPQNLGFTRTVNRGMSIHQDRDVVLLNSDTVVHGDWLDRMRTCAYALDRISTVNPMTTQFGSHIGCYPGLTRRFENELELDGKELARICAAQNDHQWADVHTTVGFCMYIKRACLNDVGLFDVRHFPIAYGEESDFCYRARKVGWLHRIAGDAYVEHFEGKSFKASKKKLMEDMLTVFTRLHPEVVTLDARFRRCDPVRPLREGLDLGRLKRLLNGCDTLTVREENAARNPREPAWLIYDVASRALNFGIAISPDSFPNLPKINLSRQIVKINHVLKAHGIRTLAAERPSIFEALKQQCAVLPFEVPLDFEIVDAKTLQSAS